MLSQGPATQEGPDGPDEVCADAAGSEQAGVRRGAGGHKGLNSRRAALALTAHTPTSTATSSLC